MGAQNLPVSPDSTTCPMCAETIKKNAVKCRFCGEDLKALAARRESQQEHEVFVGRPVLCYSLGTYTLAVLTLGLGLIYLWIRRHSIRYRITTQRLQIEQGFFSRTLNNLELFRIDDYEILRPFSMRIVGHAELRLRTSDRNNETIRIQGIPGIEDIAEEIRKHVLRERETRNIRVWADA